MWQLSTRGRYGTRLMCCLAMHYSKGPLLLKNIAEAEALSIKYLEQLVLPLREADLITASRGPHGGYTLCRAPEEITMRQILLALEGKLSPVECLSNPEKCGRVEKCPTHNLWSFLDGRIQETLEGLTLAGILVLPSGADA